MMEENTEPVLIEMQEELARLEANLPKRIDGPAKQEVGLYPCFQISFRLTKTLYLQCSQQNTQSLHVLTLCFH